MATTGGSSPCWPSPRSRCGQFDKGRRHIERALAQVPRNAHGAHISRISITSRASAKRASSISPIGRRPIRVTGNCIVMSAGISRCGRWRPAGRPTRGASTIATCGRVARGGRPSTSLTDAAAFLARAEFEGEARRAEYWTELAAYATQWFRTLVCSSSTCTGRWRSRWRATARRWPASPRPRRDPRPTCWRLWRAASGRSRPPIGTRALREIEPLLSTHERFGGSRAQRDLLEYTVACAHLRAGRAARARDLLMARRPCNAVEGGFPISGL